MKITFHGAAHTVTGSAHLIEVNGKKLLLDCGLYQGKRSEAYERNRSFRFDPKTIDAVILSHAHIDHCGNLPNLVKQGFENSIHATPATKRLADIMMRDSGHIQEADAFFVNKRRAEKHEEPIEPIYTEKDAERVSPQLKAEAYSAEFEPIPGVIASFHDAGHILGSAGIELVIQEKGKKKPRRVWFSGDIGRRKLPLLRDPVLPEETDIMIMESTYGDKSHNDPEKAYAEFRDEVKGAVDRGGKVIIPAFAVGRTQELVYWLNRMMNSGDVPSIPIFVDSPLAVEASKIFIEFPDCYDEETMNFIREKRHPALVFKMLTYVQSVEESKALNERKDPMIIISASGMAENGRILHHIKNNIENANNTILIVSWQAPNTLGRRLADRETQVKIFGDVYQRRARVATIGGLSGHAGQDLLVEYALKVKKTAKQVFLVHGEEKPALALQELLKPNMRSVNYPELHSTVEV